MAFFEVALDVLDGDGGVIYQDSNGEGETSEGHGVDGLAEGAEDDDGGKDGEGDGDGNDDRRPPAPEEEQDHQGGESGGDGALADNSGDRAADEYGLIADRREANFRGQGGEDVRKQLADAANDVEGGGVAVLEDGDEYAAAAIVPDDVGLDLEAVADAGHVAEIDGGVIGLA